MSTVELKKVRFDKAQITLAGYSRAGNATFFYVPEWRIQLDMGGFDRKYFATKFYVTHSHFDHAVYLPDVQPARVPGSDCCTLHVPKLMEKYARNYLHSAQELNHSADIAPEDEKKYHLIPLQGGDQVYVVKNKIRMRAFDCYHTVPTVGYCFFELKSKLKAEHQGKTNKEIGMLRKQGVDVSESVESPKLAFLGDTTIEVFEKHPELWSYPIIVVECTFLLDEHESAAAPSGHIHWNQLKPYILQHPTCTFVLIHWSMRYNEDTVRKFFGEMEGGCPHNVVPWI